MKADSMPSGSRPLAAPPIGEGAKKGRSNDRVNSSRALPPVANPENGPLREALRRCASDIVFSHHWVSEHSRACLEHGENDTQSERIRTLARSFIDSAIKSSDLAQLSNVGERGQLLTQTIGALYACRDALDVGKRAPEVWATVRDLLSAAVAVERRGTSSDEGESSVAVTFEDSGRGSFTVERRKGDRVVDTCRIGGQSLLRIMRILEEHRGE